MGLSCLRRRLVPALTAADIDGSGRADVAISKGVLYDLLTTIVAT